MSHLLHIEEPDTDENPRSPLAIGIDFGTTHCVVAVQKGEGFPSEVLPLYHGQPLVPSVVIYQGDQGAVGESQSREGAGYEVRSSKRILGSGGLYDYVKTDGERLTPIDVACDILSYLKDKTQTTLNQAVHEVVITVPAHFDEKARLSVRMAATKAGLKVLRLVHEPTAAALAYGLEKKMEGLYGVYDLGGGTFDFSVLRLREGVFQVIGTTGLVTLGGDDFDLLLAQYLVEKGFFPQTVLSQGIVNHSFMAQVRRMKERLSDLPATTIQVEGFNPEVTPELDRKIYEDLITPLVEKTLKNMEQCLVEVGVTPRSLDGLILVGGASRTPYIQNRLRDLYGRILLTDINPEEVVALGAAYQARTLLEGEGTLLLDVTPLSLGIETMGGIVETIIPRNSVLPAKKTCVYTTAHPDQEAILIHILQGEGPKVENCLSLGQIVLKAGRVSDEPRRIEVSFSLDVNGLLSVDAKDLHSGVQEALQLLSTKDLSKAQLSEILKKNILQ